MTGKVKETHKEPAAEKEKVVVQCPFCQHSFGILSSFSNCSVCGGKRVVMVKEPYITCRACGGTGIQPFTRLPCLACSGKGMTSVARHTETCPVCRDKGPDGFRFYCLHCQRTSVIPVKESAVAKET